MSDEPPGHERTGLPRFWLLIARIILLATAILAVLIYIVGTPVYYAQLIPSNHHCVADCITPAIIQELHARGISASDYAIYQVALNLLFAFVYFLVAALIFWRKSDDRMALLASFSLLTLGASFPSIPMALATIHPAWQVPVMLVGNEDIFAFPSLLIFFLLFPNGRFIPRWTRWMAILTIVPFQLLAFFPTSSPSLAGLPGLLIAVLVPLVFGSLVFAQIYRYRHVSTDTERQQTKWIVYSMIVALLGFLLLGYGVPTVLRLFNSFDNLGLLPYTIVITAIYLVLLLIPLSLALAILRYRLWDVDVLINKTLVYSTLTGILALLYASSILLLQYPLRGIIQQNNAIAIVVSTIAIYALFQPLRRRIQNLIDRRFYRRKYDAARTLAAFSETLRHEVDLSQLKEQLIGIVHETMQPEHVTLWLREPGEHGDRSL